MGVVIEDRAEVGVVLGSISSPTSGGAAARRGGRLRLVPSGPSLPTLAVTATDTRRDVVLARRRFVALCALVVVLFGAILAGRAIAAPAEPKGSVSVTVREGETLSQIAARELPQMETSEAVVAVQRENNLGSLHVQAGQVVQVPRR